MQTFHQLHRSSELVSISIKCSEILAKTTSAAHQVSILYRDKIGNTLTVIVPYDDTIISQLPEGGTFFTGII